MSLIQSIDRFLSTRISVPTLLRLKRIINMLYEHEIFSSC